jgi:hypothetical protein
MQCMAGAMTAGAATTGLRAWVATRAFSWLTPRRRTFITRTVMVAGVIAAALAGPTP